MFQPNFLNVRRRDHPRPTPAKNAGFLSDEFWKILASTQAERVQKCPALFLDKFVPKRDISWIKCRIPLVEWNGAYQKWRIPDRECLISGMECDGANM